MTRSVSLRSGGPIQSGGMSRFALVRRSVAHGLISALVPVMLSAQEQNHLVFPLTPDTVWWSGVVVHGDQMPNRDGYRADLRANSYGNQAQPLLLSNRGDVVWSDAPFVVAAGKGELTVDGTA